MNCSKKHKKHSEYMRIFNELEGEGDPTATRYIEFYGRRRKHRWAIREFNKQVKSGEWQKRVYEQRGIKI